MTSSVACGRLPSGLPAPVVDISFSGDSTAGQSYSLQCSASVVAGLVIQPDMEIVFPNISEVVTMSSSSLIYTFSPLRTSDGGQYTCTATVNIPQAGITDLKSTAIETLSVASECAQVYMHCTSSLTIIMHCTSSLTIIMYVRIHNVIYLCCFSIILALMCINDYTLFHSSSSQHYLLWSVGISS